MYLRRIIDTSSFVLALLVGAYLHFALEFGWIGTAIVAVLIFLATPFIVSRFLAKRLIARMEREAEGFKR
jgi:hypothetical protein